MITIPKPCKEDFSKMSATQRGAFCSKCQIDTFDFTKMPNTEINKVLLKNKGQHLCGQFTNKQLASLNEGYLNWRHQKASTFKSKFVLALMLVFGLTLFSCEEDEAAKIRNLQSLSIQKVTGSEYYVNNIVAQDALDLTALVDLEVKTENEKQTKLIEVEKQIEFVLEDEFILESDVAVDTVTAADTNALIMADEIKRFHSYTSGGDIVILGGFSGQVVNNYYEYLEEAADTAEEEEIEPQLESIPAFETKAFPNPTTTNATLTVEVTTAGQFEVVLYDMTGRLVKVIHAGLLETGRIDFILPLANEESGTYIVKVVSEGQSETLKIQKLN